MTVDDAAGTPREVLDALLRLASGDRGAAWVEFDAQGRVVEAGGALAAHGLGDLVPGAELTRSAEWLEGLAILPGQPLTLPALSLAGHHVDVHVWRAQENRGYLVIVDSTRVVKERADVLERANEASLLRERLEGAERGRRSARLERVETLNALGAEILERGPDGRFRPQGRAPAWLCAVCEWEEHDDHSISGDDPASFLGAFLAEAEDALEAGAPTLVRSGMWAQEINGRDEVFEAVAMVLSTGRRVIMVEHIDLRYRERQELLQRAREASLSHEAVRRGVEHKDVLLNCIVHDLRSPLASIAGALRLIRGRDLDPDQQRDLLDIAIRQTERQDELIRTVLEVFRAEVDDLARVDTDPRTAPDLCHVVRESVQRALPAFEERGVSLFSHLPSRTVGVIGLRDRLERVVDNLLDNALRHSPRGTSVDVAVEASLLGPSLVVADRGAGVPETLRGMLFQRFVRGSAGGAAGLGLYYCRMTVERWGGAITYRDRTGGGAEFRVQFRPA